MQTTYAARRTRARKTCARRRSPALITAAVLALPALGLAQDDDGSREQPSLAEEESAAPSRIPTRVEVSDKGLLNVDAMRADTREVLRALAEAKGANLIIDDDVSGDITLRLRDVVWVDAFEAVLRSNGLGAEVTGNIIRVAPLTELREEMRGRDELRDTWEQTAPLEVRVVPLDYADPEDVIPVVEQVLSPRGSVTYDPGTRSLIIRDVQGSEALGF